MHQISGKDTSKVPKLEAAIHEKWYNSDLQILKKLAELMSSHLQECIKRKGKQITYQNCIYIN